VSNLKLVSDKELLLLPHKDIVRFALFCAEQVRDSWKDIPECVAAIETVERWLKGKASAEECWKAANATNAAYAAYAANAAAANAAYYATSAAATSAAYAYASAASAAAYYATSAAAANVAYAYAADAAYVAAYASAGKPHLIEAQRNHYNELLHFDDIAEKLLLGESI
jgi:hypothetical protein